MSDAEARRLRRKAWAARFRAIADRLELDSDRPPPPSELELELEDEVPSLH